MLHMQGQSPIKRRKLPENQIFLHRSQSFNNTCHAEVIYENIEDRQTITVFTCTKILDSIFSLDRQARKGHRNYI